MLAEHLGVTVENLHKTYLARVVTRTTIIEEPSSRDCIFLKNINGVRGCAIYSVRPNQCRTWPFWSGNLTRPDDWNIAAKKCPGLNRGKLYTFEEIEKIKKQKKWWEDEK